MFISAHAQDMSYPESLGKSIYVGGPMKLCFSRKDEKSKIEIKIPCEWGQDGSIKRSGHVSLDEYEILEILHQMIDWDLPNIGAEKAIQLSRKFLEMAQSSLKKIN